MSGLSDTLTMGLVLVLLFGSIALYLYTRIQQTEQKVDLLESIVLNLKMDNEVKDFPELPAGSQEIGPTGSSGVDEYKPFTDVDEDGDNVHSTHDSPNESTGVAEEVDESELYKSAIADAVKSVDDVTTTPKVSVNYESMTLKELQALAKQRNIIGVSSMKKPQVLEALKTSDRAISNVEPGSIGNSSFLDSSASLENEESE